MRARQDPSQQAFVGRAMTTLVGLATGGALAMAILAPTAVRTLYSQQFAAAADLLVPLAAGGVAQALYLIFVNDLFHAKRTAVIPLLTLASGLGNVGLCYAWIPRFGLQGAAWATTGGYVLLALLVASASRLRGRLPWEHQRMLRLALVALPAWALAGWLDGRWDLPTEWAVKVALLAASAMALWSSGFVAPEEQQYTRAWLQARVAGWTRRRR
jgi:O-antigen/teichoic acid export membrane protein